MFTIQDDGPSASLSGQAADALVLDESRPIGSDTSGVTPAGLATVTANYADNFAVVNYGTDGAGSVAYKLNLSAVSVASGLYALDPTDTETVIDGIGQGSQIMLVAQLDGSIWGVVGTDHYFTISVDGAGTVTFTQLLNIWHPTTASMDEGATLTAATNGLTLTQTVTDADGDHAAATLDLSAGVFTIQDDGPTTFVPDAATVINNNSAPVTGFLDTDHLIGNNFGTDGGTVRFSATGLPTTLTSGGQPLIYTISSDGHTLTANAGSSGGPLVFTATINQATSQYTIDMNGTIDSITNIDFASGGYTHSGGNDPWFGFVIPGDNNSQDLLITPVESGIRSGSVNLNSSLFGISGGNSVGANESVRLDFVTDLSGNPSGSDYSNAADRDHTFDGHYTTNGATAAFGSTPGSTVRISAFDDPDGNLVIGDGVQDTITGIVIKYDGGQSALITANGNYTVGGNVFTVTFNVGGSVSVANVVGDSDANPGTNIAVFTATGYNALQYDYQAGATFKVGGFGAALQSTDPVHFNIPVQIVDGDGDTVSGTAIAVTANAAPPIVLDTNHDGTISYLSTDAGVLYDMNHDGSLDHTAWVAPGDSILFRDADHNGTVSNSTEFVFGHDGMTDMEALHAQYGAQLDASDADFMQFALWNDANSNGIVDAGEVQSLAAAGITSISLVSDGVASTEANGDVYVAGSSTFTYVNDNGVIVEGKVDDVAFAYATAETETELEQRFAGASNSFGMVTAAVAAMGLAAGNAAARADSPVDQGLDRATDAGGLGQQAAEYASVGTAAEASRSLLSGEHSAPANDANLASLAGPAHDLSAVVEHMLNDGGNAPISQPAALLASTSLIVDSAQSMINVAPTQVFADAGGKPGVATDGGVQQGGVVAKVLADAVEYSAPSIDAVLAHLPANGAAAALQALASHGGDAVPAWDNGHFGGFTPEAFTLITTEAMVLHHDAVQPAVNG